MVDFCIRRPERFRRPVANASSARSLIEYAPVAANSNSRRIRSAVFGTNASTRVPSGWY